MAATTSKTRLFRLLRGAGLLLALGLGYALFCTRTGWAIPCPFRTVTGLLCPGCGVTRMCLSLLRLDIAAAWQANPGLLLMLPPLGLLLGRLGVRYVKTGSTRLLRWEQVLVWSMVIALLLYGVTRNLPPL